MEGNKTMNIEKQIEFDKIKEIWHSFKEWCKDIAGLIKEHKTVAIAILVFIGLVILAVAVSMVIGKGTKASVATFATSPSAIA